MKKILALAGSLLVFAGLKAQTNPPVKKETTLPATNTGVSPTVLQKNNTIKQTGQIKHEGIKQTAKDIKLEHKDIKDIKEVKDMKEIKDIKEVKVTPAVKHTPVIIKK